MCANTLTLKAHTHQYCIYLWLFTPESSTAELSGNLQLVFGQSRFHILLWSPQELCRVDILVQWLCFVKREREQYDRGSVKDKKFIVKRKSVL